VLYATPLEPDLIGQLIDVPPERIWPLASMFPLSSPTLIRKVSGPLGRCDPGRGATGGSQMFEPHQRVALGGAVALLDVSPIHIRAQLDEDTQSALVRPMGQHDFFTLMEDIIRRMNVYVCVIHCSRTSFRGLYAAT
jgi:hypothetical protein